MVSVIAFDSVVRRHSFDQHRVSLVKTRRMNYSWTLKGHSENSTSGQGHDLIGKGHIAYQSIMICMVVLNTSMTLSLLEPVSIKSYCRKTDRDTS